MGTWWAVGRSLLTWAELAGRGLVPQASGRDGGQGDPLPGALPARCSPLRPPPPPPERSNSSHDSLTGSGRGSRSSTCSWARSRPGGTGSGCTGMLHPRDLAVFIAGLMSGAPRSTWARRSAAARSPWCAVRATTPAIVLIGTAIAIAVRTGWPDPQLRGARDVRGPLAFTSAGNNNGSAFAGLTVAHPLHNTPARRGDAGGPLHPDGPRPGLAGPVRRPETVPPSAGTLPPTDAVRRPASWRGPRRRRPDLTSPVLALGPIAEHCHEPDLVDPTGPSVDPRRSHLDLGRRSGPPARRAPSARTPPASRRHCPPRCASSTARAVRLSPLYVRGRGRRAACTAALGHELQRVIIAFSITACG